jgi:predicted dehydrogenase
MSDTDETVPTTTVSTPTVSTTTGAAWTAEPVAVGLVGAGPWAQIMHAPMLAHGPETRLAAIWARNRDAAEALARTVGTIAVGSYEELLDASDAVDFAVPPDVQARLAEQAARAGKAVMLEKPLGLNLPQARRLTEAVLTAGVPNLLVLTKRFQPSTTAFIQAAHELREAGPIRGVLASYLHGGQLPQPAGPGPFATPWRLEYGALLDLGPHLVDLVDATTGPIRAVRASGDPRTFLTVATEHAGGTGQLALSGTVSLDRSLTRVELFSEHGSLSWDTANIDSDEGWPVLRAELAAAVRYGTPVRADVARGLEIQIVLDAIERSLTSRARVTLPS